LEPGPTVKRWPGAYVLRQRVRRLEPVPPTRIQLCGLLVVELQGRRIEGSLPSRQGRLLFAYLTLHRGRQVPRDELIEALWPYAMPTSAPAALSALLSKLRTTLGGEVLRGRGEVALALPEGARVDVEDALAGVHAAESAVARGDWRRAWGPALRAQFVAGRRLLPEHEAPWIDEWRQRLDDVLDHALEAYSAACLGIGGAELAGAERTAKRVVENSPLRESGYRLLMDTLAAQGNVGEAMRVYDRARRTLGEELGLAPGPALQEAHARLLGGATSAPPSSTELRP
jgi:SARP family transcriptional regulator, regulator of embCAB operon